MRMEGTRSIEEGKDMAEKKEKEYSTKRMAKER